MREKKRNEEFVRCSYFGRWCPCSFAEAKVLRYVHSTVHISFSAKPIIYSTFVQDSSKTTSRYIQKNETPLYLYPRFSDVQPVAIIGATGTQSCLFHISKNIGSPTATICGFLDEPQRSVPEITTATNDNGNHHQ